MNRLTFEMLAKWISRASGAKILFDAQAKGACANVKTNEIKFPCDLKEHNILAALALLMHEGGHLRISKKIPNDIVKGQISHNVLNVMEDIRVDLWAFRQLPNIKMFYDRMVEDHVYKQKDEIAKSHLMTRCFINSILVHTGFAPFPDQKVMDFCSKNRIEDLVYEGTRMIENNQWDALKAQIQKILDIFGIKPEDDKPMPVEVQLVPGKGGKDGKDEAKVIGVGEHDCPGNVERFMRPSSAWDKGEGIKGPSQDILGEAAFEDITRDAFKELLNISEKKIVNDGTRLNSDRLVDFFVGEIESLFVEDETVKIKKSKIAFCLDASGSMQGCLMDGSQRTHVLVKTVRSIIDILKELQNTEGLNIQYDVWAFDYDAEKLSPDSWEKDYSARGGGTNLLTAFVTVQEDILSNQDIDGNKMVILMTDGEVSEQEIAELRNHIIKHGAEVKCMVLGIGADMGGHFVTTIAGDNNILAQEHANAILMDAIKTMVE